MLPPTTSASEPEKVKKRPKFEPTDSKANSADHLTELDDVQVDVFGDAEAAPAGGADHKRGVTFSDDADPVPPPIKPRSPAIGERLVPENSMKSIHHRNRGMQGFLTDVAGTFGPSQVFGFFIGIGFYAFLMLFELDERYPKANDMLAITVLVSAFWVFEVLPLPATALLPVVLMPFNGIMKSSVASASYWSWVQMLFFGAFLVDIAVEHVNLHRRIALRVLLKVGTDRPWGVVLAFMLISFFLSMWCSNTATTVMLVPFATGLVDSAMQGSASSTGGLGASSREVALEGSDGSAISERSSTEASAGSYNRFAVAVLLAIAYGSTAGGIATLVGTPPNGVLAGLPIASGGISAAEWFWFAVPFSGVLAIFVFASLYVCFLRGLRLKLNERIIRETYAGLGPVGRDEMLVAFIQFLQFASFLIRVDVINNVELTGVEDLAGINDATLACGAAVLLFFLPSEKRPGEVLLPWDVAQEHLPWGVLLLMGGGFAIAKGFQESELTRFIGGELASFANGTDSLALTYAVFGVVCLLTEVTSNTATASIILPILGAVSAESLIHPFKLMLPATVACSVAFMLPVATPPNSVVFATKRLKLQNLVFAGGILNVLAIAAGGVLIHSMAQTVFDVNGPFPQWACLPEACTWLPIPGFVDGQQVAGQACALLSDGLCRLRSGDEVNLTALLAD